MFLLEIKIDNLLVFVIAILCLGGSTYLNFKNSPSALLLLFIGAFFLGLFYSKLDPFLNLWDEQFHALVAKNLSKDFLTPKLYNTPSLPLDYKYWVANEIWLHKQPLFLWQMACSIKLFGNTVFAVRFPSILMHSLVAILIFKIGIITLTKKTGFYGALIFTVASYPLELVVGKYSTDHNDIAFLFYTTASFWAWFEYQETKKRYWIFLIGLFSGCAVLVKWLMGLLVFVIWGVVKLLLDQKKLFTLRNYQPLLLSFTISLLIFLPWQIYIFQAFPAEASHEFTYNSMHLYEAIEGHDGDWSFHLSKGLKKLYGDSNLLLFILAIAIILTTFKLKDIKFKLFYVLIISFVYLFFSLVKTKMISYPLVVFPFVCLAIGYFIYFIEEQFKFTRLKPFIVAVVLLYICFISFNFDSLYHNHIKNRKSNHKNLIGEFKALKLIGLLDNYLNKEDYILFNDSTVPFSNISTMFFTDYESYGFIPTKEQLMRLKESGKKLACLHTADLPEYILEDKSIRLVPLPVLEKQKSH